MNGCDTGHRKSSGMRRYLEWRYFDRGNANFKYTRHKHCLTGGSLKCALIAGITSTKARVSVRLQKLAIPNLSLKVLFFGTDMKEPISQFEVENRNYSFSVNSLCRLISF